MDVQIESKLRANLSVQHLIIKDTSGGCGQSYELVLVAEQFEQMGLLARQQKVNEILSEEISQIHAL
jgi:stress-induced morphogen